MQHHERGVRAEALECQRRFAEWRQAGRRGRRIPDELWRMAMDLARRQGTNRTGLQLRLNPTVLKQRLVRARSASVREAAKPVRFVEFAVAGTARDGDRGWVIELEDGRGAKLRVEVGGGSPPELAELTRAFLREPR